VRPDLRVILGWTLCGDGGQDHLLGRGGLDDRQARLGENVEADIAAHLGPPVVLFGEHGADDTGEGLAVGEDPDDA
jgi:hypothetical protein